MMQESSLPYQTMRGSGRMSEWWIRLVSVSGKLGEGPTKTTEMPGTNTWKQAFKALMSPHLPRKFGPLCRRGIYRPEETK